MLGKARCLWKDLEVERPVSYMYEDAVTEPMTFLADLKINTYPPHKGNDEMSKGGRFI